ncbi:2-C-methyl-D-erythritol 4-phosphate cytidylyltransferase [Brachybacterium sp. UMB0905]|uniref:IspD/TarI family cytidylyltransferase n=1 Tax=Brachybacterium sp. UMB0905 TaxID=2069310 RepID=UPI000C80A257|nr:2-C-methyl-D-erythritol 4-phosphate cytidylyltransferase [Brachybacterium sp. UMB0905]PMC75493.1 4-diphosphocytidyl-2C-methyl-D-erythritol kinase [Brachybacterium sp. UMB0905]
MALTFDPATVRPLIPALAPAAAGVAHGREAPCLTLLGGSRLIDRLLHTLEQLGLGAPIVLAPAPALAALRQALPSAVQVRGVEGDRSAALREGLAATDAPLLLIHDAERALTPRSVIEQVLGALTADVDAVVPVTAVTDSVKAVRSDGLHNVDRESLATLQSPRLLRRELLEQVLAAPADGGTDEIQLALAHGAQVRTVPGSHAGAAIVDRLSLWQAQISLGLARDTSHRHGLARS